MNETKSGWWIFGKTTVHIYDMNGREIDNKYIGYPQPPSTWRKILFPLPTAIGYASAVKAFEIYETTTLGELLHDISHATKHPWSRLQDGVTGNFVKTSDGKDIVVNPRTMQLTDWGGFALYNNKSGLPIIFYENDIVTVSRGGVVAGQQIQNDILLESMTVMQLLQSGTPFYMHLILTPFGYVDVPVLNQGTDEAPEFTFMNGESTKGVTLDHYINHDTDTGFFEGIANFFNTIFGGEGWSIWQILLLIGGIILLILLIPILIPVFKLIGAVIMIPVSSIKRRNNNKQRNDDYEKNDT